MNILLKLLKLVLVASFIALAGCATSSENSVNPNKNKRGILIVAGEGFNPSYAEAHDQKVKATWLETAKKLAGYIETEIDMEHHTESDHAVNLDAGVDANTFIAQQFAQKRVDGLIQVRISHIKNAAENTIYLLLAYNAVQYGSNALGDTMIIGPGIEEKYTLLGRHADGMKTPLNYFTHDFIRKLSQQGFIGH